MVPGINPLGNFFPTIRASMDATTWTTQLDACMSQMQREAARFAPMTWPAQFGTSMTMMIAPGSYYNGTTLNDVGAWATGNTTSGSANITSMSNTSGIADGMVAMAFTYTPGVSTTGTTASGSPTMTVTSATGMFIGMAIYGANIAASTLITNVVGTTITLSINATGTGAATVTAAGMQPLSTLGATVTAISGTQVTISANATGTVTGAYLCFAWPIGTIISCVKHGTTGLTGLASTAGIFVGMAVSGTGIAGGTTVSAVPTSTTVTLSAAASDSLTSNLTFSVLIPGSNSRLDMVSINATTGVVVWTVGTAAATPSLPGLPGGCLPVAAVSTATGTTSLAPANVGDIRILNQLGTPLNYVPLAGTGSQYITGSLRMSQNSTDTPGYGNTVTGASLQNASTGNDVTWFNSRDQAAGGTNVAWNNNSLGGGGFSIAEQYNYQGVAVGSVTITATTTAFNLTSDYRLKNTFDLCPDAWRALAKIPIYLTEFKADPGKIWPMALAHEVAEHAPEMVTGAKNAVYGEDGPRNKEGELIYPVGTINPQMVDWSKAGPRLLTGMAALEQALDKIQGLEEELANLRETIRSLT